MRRLIQRWLDAGSTRHGRRPEIDISTIIEAMDETAVVKALGALAQPVRLQIFRALVIAGPRGMTPSTMADGLGMAPSTLSFHLKELANAGLVTQERASRNLIYRAAYDRMNALLGYLTRNCCQGAECAIPAPGPRCGN